jgi:toxin ParE1/3/4
MSPASWSVVITPSAEADLVAIYDYIAERAGARTAHRFVNGIEAYCLAMTNTPERGTRRDDLRRGLRTVGFRRRATILFHLDRPARKVVILGIYYAGRNLAPGEEPSEDEI